MTTYHQLTREQRYQIAALLESGHNQSEIALCIGVHKATVSRELHRNGNRTRRGYLPRHAHLLALARRASKARCRLNALHWAEVHRLVRLDWSPEQIAGRAVEEGAFRVSPEWIYQHLLHDQRQGGDLHRHLRCQKIRRKRYGKARRVRGAIAGRIGIAWRPAVVATRRRLGDWEGDTLAGSRWRTGVLTLVERKSRFTRLGRLCNKSADVTARVATRRLRPLVASMRTLTVDNGQEFARHQRITQGLKVPVYFADPYAPWQRGTVENVNGLLRQYFPKTLDFTTVTARQLRRAEDRLNHRPRKCLGYKTPHEVFFNTTTRLVVAVGG
jgi:IS30 family transposase